MAYLFFSIIFINHTSPLCTFIIER